MLAIEFVKHIDDFTFKNKTRLLYWFALADIDPSYIYKTSHKVCSSYSEAFLLKERDQEAPMIGLFTDQQLKYITDAKNDLIDMEKSVVKVELSPEQKAEDKIQEFRDQVEYEEIQCIIKMVWSFMVF